MNAKPDVILYHVPPSFYSQIARLALVEKGVAWHAELVLPGPPIFESYRPWYMKLNPGGTVPTLVHNGEVVPDSILIAEYAERVFDGPRLIPRDSQARSEMQRWVDALGDISIRELSYGSGNMKVIGAWINGLRIKRLRSLAAKHPDLAVAYRAKEQDMRGFTDNAMDAGRMDEIRAHVATVLDEMDKVLESRDWLAGDSYSLADIVWTVTVARLKVLSDVPPLDGRPALACWYEAVRRRPSFDAADVWERMKPGKMMAMIVTKLWPQLTAVGLALAALCAVIWWFV